MSYGDYYLVSVRDRTIRRLRTDELDDLGRMVSSQRRVIRGGPEVERLLKQGYRMENPGTPVDRRKASIMSLASDYKARGMDKWRAWSQFVTDRGLLPGINADEFYKYYEVAEPRLLPAVIHDEPEPVKESYADPELADYGRRVIVTQRVGRHTEEREGTVYRTMTGSSGEAVYEVDFGDGPQRLPGSATVRFVGENPAVFNPKRFIGEWVSEHVYRIGSKYYYAFQVGNRIYGSLVFDDTDEWVERAYDSDMGGYSRVVVLVLRNGNKIEKGFSYSEPMPVIDERDPAPERKTPQTRGEKYNGWIIVRHKTPWGMKYFASQDQQVVDPDWAENNADYSSRDKDTLKARIDERQGEANPQIGVYTINSGTLPILRRLATEYGQSKLVRVSPSTTANEMHRQAEILESKGQARDLEIFKVYDRAGTYGYAPAGLLDQATDIQEQEEGQKSGPDPRQLAKVRRAAETLESKIDAIRDKYGAKADKLIDEANRALDLYEQGDSVQAAQAATRVERQCPRGGGARERGVGAACRVFLRELTREENPNR